MLLFRIDCLAKSRDLQARLLELKTEMEALRADTPISVVDRLHEENVEKGENKYSTLLKVGQIDVLDFALFTFWHFDAL